MSTLDILQVVGGLGLFLVGMRIMGEGLQKIAGRRLRAVLAGLTKNRIAGVFSGFLVTAAIQSSSATTVLVVSFANAGLLSLVQAIGLVMGANIGTTVTAWIVAIFGFKIKISAFALPIIGIAFVLSRFKNPRLIQLSEVFVGFGLLFLGLKFLKDGVPDLRENPQALDFLQSFAHSGFASVLFFALVGLVVTAIVQSSSASTAVFLTMAAKGWVSFDLAAAMVVGSNIGTTITAQIAAIGSSRNAKRVAHSHTLFNVTGALLALPLLAPSLAGIDAIVPGDPWLADDSNALVITAHLAAYHTAFNVCNTLILLPFVDKLARVVLWLLPLRDDEIGGSRLRFLETGLVGTAELEGLQVRRALREMLDVCLSMFEHLRRLAENPSEKLGDVVDEVKRGEVETDEMEEELVYYCARLARSRTSARVGRQVAAYLEMANDIERMGDFCFNLVLLAERRHDKQYEFGVDAQKQLMEMMSLVDEFMKLVELGLDGDRLSLQSDADLLESKINNRRDEARKFYTNEMQKGAVRVKTGLIFLDMMTNLEKLGDNCHNLVAAQQALLEDS